MNNERMQLTYLDVFNNLNARNILASGITAKTGNFDKLNASNLVYNTGNQVISGAKTFTTGIIAPNLVYTTGNQTIDGNKNFIGSPFQIDNGLYLQVTSGGIYTQPNATYFNNNNDINFDFGHLFLTTRLSIGYNTGILQPSINSQNTEREIKIYETGVFFAGNYSYGPYLRMGRYGTLISETSENKVGIGTLFPQQKVHISGGNLRVDGNISANNLNDLVYTTGTQVINGTKNFTDNINFTGSINQSITFGRTNGPDLRTRIVSFTGDYGLTFIGRGGAIPFAHGYGIVFEGGPTLNKKGYFTAASAGVANPTGYQYATLDWTNRILSGQWITDKNIKVGDAYSVLTTGDQTISGIKNFASRPTVNGTGVLLVGEGGGGGGGSFVSPPATPTSAGTQYSLATDSNYLYVCVATNSWKRTALAVW